MQSKMTVALCDTQSETLQLVLENEGIELRYNSRANIEEFRIANGDWQHLTNERKTEWRTRMIPKGYEYDVKKNETKPLTFTPGAFEDAITVLSRDRVEDPFIADYLSKLPTVNVSRPDITWIGNPDSQLKPRLLCDRIFLDLFGMTPEADLAAQTDEDEELRWLGMASRLIYTAAIARAYEPGCKYDLIVAVSGKQGAGKDTLFKASLPQLANQNLHTTNLDLGADDKHKIEQIMGTVFAISSELAGLSRLKDIEKFKNFASTETDKVRLSYRKDTEHYKRTSIIVGTTNYDRPIPNDQTGNRRWVVVKLPTGRRAVMKVEDWFDEVVEDARFDEPMTRRDIIWAEAKALYDAGVEITLPANMAEVQGRKNGTFSNMDTQMESAWDIAISCDTFGNGRNISFDPLTPITASGLAFVMGLTDHPNNFVSLPNTKQIQMTKFLEGLGYRRKHARIKTHHATVRKMVFLHDDVDLNDTFDLERVTGDIYVNDDEFGTGGHVNKKKRMRAMRNTEVE